MGIESATGTGSKESGWRRLDRMISAATGALGTVCHCIIFFMTSIISYEVFARYILHTPTIWVTETTQYLLPFICFFGASYCLQQEGHINVNLLVARYSPRHFEISLLATNLLTMIFAVTLTWQGYLLWEEAWTSNFTSGGLFDIPLWIPYISFPLGMLFLCFQLVSHIVRNVERIKELGS
jgi:TRAP-type C4-dicarboxylate transport system permease small subunit